MATETARPRTEYKVVGTRPIRHDGVDKVTGAARFGADITLPGLLHGKVLRPTQVVVAGGNLGTMDTQHTIPQQDKREEKET